ncbi:hypothetical protein GE21DRAFT_1233545 [Neurospora crassa]|nr:hypothetical protein GE21DRAFT_1233545 [Neurospora crassa]
MGGDASLNAGGPKDTTTCNVGFASININLRGDSHLRGGPKGAQRDGRRLGRRTKQPTDGGVPNPEQAGGPKSTRPSSN